MKKTWFDIEKAMQYAGKKATMGLEMACVYVETEVKRSMKPGHGRLYLRGKRGKMHRASSPGEPPAVDTGRYRSSISHLIVSFGKKYKGYVGSNVIYGKFLEFGTRKMAPRPHWKPILEQRDKILQAYLEGAKR